MTGSHLLSYQLKCDEVNLRLLWPILGILLIGCKKESEKIKPEIRKLTEFVYASASVEPMDAYQVYSSVNGVIENVYIEENDIVNAGQRLGTISNSVPQTNVEKAELNTSLAEQNYERQYSLLRTLENDIASARLKLETDSINYARQKRLWSKNIGSESEYDNRKLAYELSKNNLLSLKSKYQISKLELENQMQTQIQLAKASLKSSKANNEDFDIKSNMNGKVYAVYKNAGESILMQEPFAKIGMKDTFLIEMEVDEVDVARLRAGQLVLINLDAYGNQVFEASISKIYPQKDLRSQTFKIEGKFVNPPEVLYPGLSGEANIVISEKEAVLTIPLDFLIEGNKVKTEDGEVEIVTGLRDMKSIEVISGIDSSMFILKPE